MTTLTLILWPNPPVTRHITLSYAVIGSDLNSLVCMPMYVFSHKVVVVCHLKVQFLTTSCSYFSVCWLGCVKCKHHLEKGSRRWNPGSCLQGQCWWRGLNSTNVLDEGLRIGETGRRMNSKVNSVKQGGYESKHGCRTWLAFNLSHTVPSWPLYIGGQVSRIG
jgi:hypothetical protein